MSAVRRLRLAAAAEADARPVVLSIDVADEGLAARLAAALAGAVGVALAPPGAPADVVLVDATREHESGEEIEGESEEGAGPPQPVDLSSREREVLTLMTTGASNRDIAAALGISVHTAKFHVGRVIDKLDATGRTDAVAQAARIGVVAL